MSKTNFYKRNLSDTGYIGSPPREPRVNLTCLLHSMHGQPINVNGTTYLVSPSGALDNIPQTDAIKLLANEACWRLCPADADSMPQKANGEPADLTMPGEPTYRAGDLRAPPAGITEGRGATAGSKAEFSFGGQKVSWATVDNVLEAVPYTISQPASQKRNRSKKAKTE